MAFRDACIVAFAFAVLAVVVNAWLHPEGIPFVAEREYDIMVPCPEPGGEVSPMAAGDARLRDPRTFIVDARDASDYGTWHFREALNLTYDYLDPTPDASIEALARAIARSLSQQVLVYGDGDDPDTGEQLGKEISGKGIKNVFFLKGGAPLLRQDVAKAAGEKMEDQP